MEMPAEVYATLASVVEKYPHAGDDEARRSAMEKAVATIRARHGERWVWKTEHASLVAPSKDAIGYVEAGPIVHGQAALMWIWDTINGTSRAVHPAPLNSYPARLAYVLAVPPKDWLGDGVPTEPVDPPPPGNTSDLLKRIGEAEQRLKDLEAKISGAALDASDARQIAMAISERVAKLRLVAAPPDPKTGDPGADPIGTSSRFGHSHDLRVRIVS